MIVTCPQCKVRFVVAPTAIGEDGRRVQCSQCRTVWFEPPLPEEETLTPEAVITPARPPKKLKITKSKTAAVQTPAPVLSQNLESDRKKKNRPDTSGARKFFMVAGWGMLMMLSMGMTGSVYFFRDHLSKRYEPAARLYEKWDALVVGKPPHSREQSSPVVIRQPHPSNYLELHQNAQIRFAKNIPSLFLNLELLNNAPFDVTLPPVHGVIRNRSGTIIHSWWPEIETAVVAAKGRVQMEVVVDPLPADAASAELFLDWD